MNEIHLIIKLKQIKDNHSVKKVIEEHQQIYPEANLDVEIAELFRVYAEEKFTSVAHQFSGDFCNLVAEVLVDWDSTQLDEFL